MIKGVCSYCKKPKFKQWYVVAGTFEKTFLEFSVCESCKNYINMLLMGALCTTQKQVPIRADSQDWWVDEILFDSEPHYT